MNRGWVDHGIPTGLKPVDRILAGALRECWDQLSLSDFNYSNTELVKWFGIYNANCKHGSHNNILTSSQHAIFLYNSSKTLVSYSSQHHWFSKVTRYMLTIDLSKEVLFTQTWPHRRVRNFWAKYLAVYGQTAVTNSRKEAPHRRIKFLKVCICWFAQSLVDGR